MSRYPDDEVIPHEPQSAIFRPLSQVETDENQGSRKHSTRVLKPNFLRRKKKESENIIRLDGFQNTGGDEATVNSDENQVELTGTLRFENQSLDKEIIQKFTGLINKVQTWASKFSNDLDAQFNHVEKRTLDQFFKVMPNEYSRTEALADLLIVRKRYFIQGWIGLVLVDEIFQYFTDDGRPGSNGQDFWIGEYNAKALKTLERSFLSANRKFVSHEDYNNWRAFTLALMSGVERSQTSRTRSRHANKPDVSKYTLSKSREIARQIMDVVKPWLVQEEQDRQDQLRALETALIDIMGAAMELSKLLRSQRACWSVYYPSPLFSLNETSSYADVPPLQTIDPSTMKQASGEDGISEFQREMAQGQEPQVLELFVTPALFKRGNSDGELYDENSCIVRATVICKEPSRGYD